MCRGRDAAEKTKATTPRTKLAPSSTKIIPMSISIYDRSDRTPRNLSQPHWKTELVRLWAQNWNKHFAHSFFARQECECDDYSNFDNILFYCKMLFWLKSFFFMNQFSRMSRRYFFNLQFRDYVTLQSIFEVNPCLLWNLSKDLPISRLVYLATL